MSLAVVGARDPGADAEAHAAKRFPHKPLKRVSNGLRPRTIRGFLDTLPHVFQRGQSAGLSARYHFSFHGAEEAMATIVIHDKRIEVFDGHVGRPDLRIAVDAQTWIGFLAKEKSLLWAVLCRRIRLRGSQRLLLAFGRCFPS